MLRLCAPVIVLLLLVGLAHGQAVQVSSRRVDLDPTTQEQFIDLWYTVGSDYAGASYGPYSAAGDFHVTNAIGDVKSANLVTVSSNVGATAQCNASIGATARGALVGVSGNVNTVINSGQPNGNSLAQAQVRTASSNANFQILPHPSIPTTGQATLAGRFFLLANGGDANIEPTDTFTSVGAVNLAGSNLTVIWTGNLPVSQVPGWIVAGVLTQSSATNPTAAPINYYQEFPGPGFTLDIFFSQVVAINSINAMGAVTDTRAAVGQFGSGQESITRGVSLYTSYTATAPRANP